MFVLASQSPRRKQLLEAAGYAFVIKPPPESAECGICSRETPPEMVARLARQKAAAIAPDVSQGIVLACDTLAECRGTMLGKPQDRDHARQTLQLLRGTTHHVYSGLCLWPRPDDQPRVEVDVTKLTMDPVTDQQIEEYLDTDLWVGKAGAFGYQDGVDWLHIVQGSESNVVGLPMELLEKMLRDLQS